MPKKDDYKSICNKCGIKTWYETEQPCHKTFYDDTKCTGTLKIIDNSKLDDKFTRFYDSEERVEVEWKEGYEDFTGYGCRTNGKKARFYVGKSTGWKPIYIMVFRRNSFGGGAILSEAVKSIKGLGTYRYKY